MTNIFFRRFSLLVYRLILAYKLGIGGAGDRVRKYLLHRCRAPYISYSTDVENRVHKNPLHRILCSGVWDDHEGIYI